MKKKKIKPGKLVNEVCSYSESRFKRFDFNKARNTLVDATFARQIFDASMVKVQYGTFNESCKIMLQASRAAYIFHVMQISQAIDPVEIDMLIMQFNGYDTKQGIDKFTHDVDDIFDIFEVKAKARYIRLSNIGTAINMMNVTTPQELKQYKGSETQIEYAMTLTAIISALTDEFDHALNN